jgi:hypothetical protein
MRHFSVLLVWVVANAVLYAQVPNIRISSDDSRVGKEVSLSAVRDTNGNLHILVHCMEGSSSTGTTCYVSTDYGATWSGGANTSGGYAGETFDPTCAIAYKSGRANACFNSHDAAYAASLALSTNFGASWNSSLKRVYHDTSGHQDFPTLCLRCPTASSVQDTVYVGFRWFPYSGSADTFHVFRSTNNGSSFSAWGTFLLDSAAVSPQMIAGSDGNVFVVGKGVLWKRNQAAGSTWSRIDSIPLSDFMAQEDHSTGILYSIATAPDTGLICFAYVKANGGIAMRSAYAPFHLSSSSAVDVDSGAKSDSALVPRVAVDSLGRCIAVAYAVPTDTSNTYYNLKVAWTTDGGATWFRAIVSDAPCEWLRHDGILSDNVSMRDFFGICFLDAYQIGVAWSDLRGGQMHTYFATLNAGTMFRNAFDNTYAFTLTYFPTTDTTDKHVVKSMQSRLLAENTYYKVRPDSVRHNDLGLLHNNFLFATWNPFGVNDSALTHQFVATGLRAQVQEAYFKHIDSLVVTNDLENATWDSLRWATGYNIVPSIAVVPSPWRIDTASRYPVYYDFRTRNRFDSVLGTYWWFENWLKNGHVEGDVKYIASGDTSHVLKSVVDSGPH